MFLVGLVGLRRWYAFLFTPSSIEAAAAANLGLLDSIGGSL